MSWQDNISEGCYRLNPKHTKNCLGDSLHHTAVLTSVIRLRKDILRFYDSIVQFPLKERKTWTQRFLTEHRELVRSKQSMSSFISDEQWDEQKAGFKWDWWKDPETVTRDQTMAFVMGLIIQRKKIRAIGLVSKLFWQTLLRGFRFPNRLENETLVKKPWYSRDLLTPESLSQWGRALWYLFPLRYVGDFFGIFDAIYRARHNKDDIKFLLWLTYLTWREPYNPFVRLAAWLYVHLKIYDKDAEWLKSTVVAIEGERLETKWRVHPVMTAWAGYYRPSAGHTSGMYELALPLLIWFVIQHGGSPSGSDY